MKAMILAAGRGQRLRPLTDTTPKPLIKVGPQRLIEYHLSALSAAGFKHVIINVSYLGQQIIDTLGNGQHYGIHIDYSCEAENEPLETGGGIFHALPLLGKQPFLVINGDIWTDYPLARLPKEITGLAHLVLVDNPAHVPNGDFYLQGNYVKHTGEGTKLTYAGINIFHPQLFADCNPGVYRVPPLLLKPMENNLVTGEHYRGRWIDVGSIERLQALTKIIESQ